MIRFRHLVLILAVAGVWLSLSGPVSSQIPTGAPSLTGMVRSSAGQPLEGVAVSAKGDGSRMTTSVWTNQKGEYSFPPLPDGRYRIWAQAVGFTLTRAEQALAGGKTVQQNVTLPPYAEAWRQFDDVDWFNSLPEGTPEDRGIPGRMKRVLHYTCGTCHNTAFLMEKRFTASDWELLFDYMTMDSHRVDPPYDGADITHRARNTEYEDDMPGGGKFPTKMVDEQGRPIGAQRRLFAFYKKDIISYLTRVRGPEAYPIKWQPTPRPSGEATNIVVTEYDLPVSTGTLGRLDPKTGRITAFTLNRDGTTSRNDNPPYYINDYRTGGDWSRGGRSQFQEISQHDIKVGRDGYIYLPPGIGRDLDPQGNVWFSGAGGGVKFDIKAESFTTYPLPKGWQGFENGKGVDSQGYFWAATAAGAYRMDPKTGEYTLFPSVTPLGRPYGLTVDREDKAWFAQIAADKIGWVDGRTGDVGEVALPPISDEPMLPEDREINRGWTFNQAIYQKGPRRLQADPRGDYVYAASYFGGLLSQIHIRTKQLREFKLPGIYRFGNPYEPSVDKNGIVWLSMSNADVLAKFDPRTGRFTIYPLPTRTTNARNIDVDSKPEVPEVWIPYSAAGKVARVQFRTNPAR